MNKFYINIFLYCSLVLFVLIISGCSKDNLPLLLDNTILTISTYKTHHEYTEKLKNKILYTDIRDFQNFLKKHSLRTINDLNIKNPDHYYLFAKLFKKKFNNNSWTIELLKKAINSNNVFKNEAFFDYVNLLINNNDFIKLKRIINKNQIYLLGCREVFLLDYASNASLEEIIYIPENIEYMSLIYEIIKKDPSVLKDSGNLKKIKDYIINSSIYYEKNNEVKKQLGYIANILDKDSFVNAVYNYSIRNKNDFIYYLEQFLNHNDNITDKELAILKELSIKLGQRKKFYHLLSNHFNDNELIEYYYGLEIINYEGVQRCSQILKESELLNEENLLNYYISFNKLYYAGNINEQWIKNVINYVNKYYSYKKSKELLYFLVKNIILKKKEELFVNVINKLSLDRFDPKLESCLLYYKILLSKNGKNHNKEIIKDKYPLSYFSLKTNNAFHIVDYREESPDSSLKITSTGKNLLKKIDYYLDFNFIKEVKMIDTSTLNDFEKIQVYEVLHNYFLDKKDYYRALAYSGRMSNIKYGKGLSKVDEYYLIKKLFPLYYKDYVFKYARSYDIEPALAFAVIREESHFGAYKKSWQNATGLMQILPSTGEFIAQKLKIKKYNLRNPEDNIMMGIYYLKFLKRYFSQTNFILASYNAGQGNMLKWYRQYNNYPEDIICELIPYRETREYIQKVMRSYYVYDYIISREKFEHLSLLY